MPNSRKAHPLLHLYRISVPWSRYPGTLLLATPRRRPPRTNQEGWQNSIMDAIYELRSKVVFNLVSESQVRDRLEPWSLREETSKGEHLYWPGWETLILPSGWRPSEPTKSEGTQIDFLPTVPPADPREWDHQFQWAIEVTIPSLMKQLQGGCGAIYFCPDGIATAGLLPALLSLLGDPMVHPGKVVWPLGDGGLGLTPFQHGILLGLSMGDWRAKFSLPEPPSWE